MKESVNCLRTSKIFSMLSQTNGSHSNFTKSVTVDDFRGISISQVISKVFEKCVLSRYEMFLLRQIINLGLNAV